MRTYQDKFSPLYNGLPFMKIRGNRVKFPCVAETKLNGEFQYLIVRNGVARLLNKQKYGRIREDMTCLHVDLPDDSIFMGELIHGKGKVFQDFLRHKLTDNLRLGIFGTLRLRGVDVWKRAGYAEQRDMLERLTFYNDNIFLVPAMLVENQAELDDAFSTVTGAGYEGLVVKGINSSFFDGNSQDWLKRKAQGEADLVIMGFQSGTSKVKDISLLLGHKVGNSIEPLTHCAGGLDFAEKSEFLKVLHSMIIGKSGKDFLVEPKIVVTVNHFGIIRNPDGSVSSLSSAQFQRICTDKTPESIDSIV